MTTVAGLDAPPQEATSSDSVGDWKRFTRVAWIQHRPALLACVLISTTLAVAMVVELVAQRHPYAAFVGAGCGRHPLAGGGACPPTGAVLGGSAEFQVLGWALLVLPLLTGVFLGAPFVARELELGTFRFAWTQGVGRKRVVAGTFGALAAGTSVLGVLLGLLYGGVYAHMYQVMISPGFTQYQLPFFATTWWLMPIWLVFGLSVGLLVGIVLGRLVSAMIVSGVVIGGFIAANYLLLPQMLRVGVQVHRLITRSLSPDTFNLNSIPAQFGWGLPAGSWVVSGSPAKGTDFALDLAYQPPGHFWYFQAAEGVVLLGLTAACVAVALCWLCKRSSA